MMSERSRHVSSERVQRIAVPPGRRDQRSASEKGMHFWDYGNAFLLEASRAGAAITRSDGGFRYPSYVEDIMGPMCFDYGFGPFRWVCTSGRPEDLETRPTGIAGEVLSEMAASAPSEIREQLLDNLRWIQQARGHRHGRGLAGAHPVRRRARAANGSRWPSTQAIRDGSLSAPVVLGRDHHDVSGTDSPYRETADIRDGSSFCADMAVHNVIGDAFRGATWVSLHNGGGVGWGEVINGGFGLLLDGSDEAARRVEQMIAWDVTNGLARRAWARNPGARFAVERAMAAESRLQVTLPNQADDQLLSEALKRAGES